MSSDRHFRVERSVDLAVQLAHDVRSPISAVVALTEGLRDELGAVLSEQQRHQLNLIYNAGLQLEYLVSDLLELNRPEADLAHMAPGPFSVSSVLEGVAALLQPVAEMQGQRVEVRSAVAEDLRLGQPAALSRILVNLAAPPLRTAGVQGVALGADPLDGDRVRFSVSCPGYPADPDRVERVRDVALSGAPRTSLCFSNLGLELAFHLADRMSASLEVDYPEDEAVLYRLDASVPLAEVSASRGISPTRVAAPPRRSARHGPGFGA